MGNLIKNIISLLLIFIGIIGVIIWVIQYGLMFIWNGIIHTTVYFWGVWFILSIFIGFILILLIPEKSGLSIKKQLKL